MKMNYFVDSNGRYIGAFSEDLEMPEGSTQVDAPPDNADQPWLFPGWGSSPSEAIAREEAWRELQIPLIANQLNALEEAEADVPPPDLLGGTRKEWLRYRGDVRNWILGTAGYPDEQRRPKAPH